MVGFLLHGFEHSACHRGDFRQTVTGELNQGGRGGERREKRVDQPVSTESSFPPRPPELSIAHRRVLDVDRSSSWIGAVGAPSMAWSLDFVARPPCAENPPGLPPAATTR